MNATKTCPFCAEEIKIEAIKCKHCGSDLTEIIQKGKEDVEQKRREQNEKIKLKAEKNKTSQKFFLVVVAFFVGLFIHLISIPILIIWFIWKKTNIDRRKKVISTLVIISIYIIWVSTISYINRTPTITILEPENNFTVQAENVDIKGEVDPKNAIIKINGQNLNITNGNFVYTAELTDYKNSFKLISDNRGRRAEADLIINRIFTDEEKVILEQTKEEEKQKQAKLKAEADAKRAQAEIDNKIKQVEDTKTNLNEEIEAIKTFNGDEYRYSIEKINQEILLFTTWAGLASETKNNEDIGIQQLGKELENKLSQLLINEYPQIRSAWGTLMKTTLWEHNIEVKVFGTKNNTIELVGIHFANNANIKTTHDTLYAMLKKLRFDRINYKWSEYDTEYTYYDITSKADSDIN